MAPKASPAPIQQEAVTARTQQSEPTAGLATPYDWDALDAPAVMPTKAGTAAATANVIETVPEQIRHRAETCLILNTQAVTAKQHSTAKRARVIYVWHFQRFPDERMAVEFDRLLARYAKYRPAIDGIPFAGEKVEPGQVTARTGNPGWFTRDAEGSLIACPPGTDGAVYGMRFSVRPLEQKGDARRLPGTA